MRLITPSQLSLFSISPVIGAWWQEKIGKDLPFEMADNVASKLMTIAQGHDQLNEHLNNCYNL